MPKTVEELEQEHMTALAAVYTDNPSYPTLHVAKVTFKRWQDALEKEKNND